MRHSKVIAVIWKHIDTSEANYFSMLELLKGLQDHKDGTIGKILIAHLE